MSDTLQGREDQMDQHQVNKSGTCVIPGCPCRGWSAQETSKEVNSQEPKRYCGHPECGYENCQYQRIMEQVASEHQPAAPGGGGEQWEYGHYDGRAKGFYINNVPDVPSDYVRIADVTYHDEEGRREAEARARQIVTEHNQHQSLVAERERLREALRATLNSLSRTVRKSYPNYPEEQMQISETMTVADARMILNDATPSTSAGGG